MSVHDGARLLMVFSLTPSFETRQKWMEIVEDGNQTRVMGWEGLIESAFGS